MAVAALAIDKGTFAAGDTDPYGYVSQADLLASGSIFLDQQFSLTMGWRGAESAFVPPGFTEAPVAGFVSPRYPHGLPLVMAAFEWVSGVRDGVFYVVPLMGAIVVCLTAALGAKLHSHYVGALAALVLVTSPSFLLQVLQPVSDVPAATWWTLSLVLALRFSAWSALGSGLAASMAVLTRPNLVLLVVVMGAFLLRWPTRRSEMRASVVPVTLFFTGVAPAIVGVLFLNRLLYGSPLQSGYGSLRELYAWSNVLPNLALYSGWLIETQTPFLCLAAVAPFLSRNRRAAWLLLAFAATCCILYLPYGVFEGWW